MSSLRLLIRTLWYFRAANVFVAVAVAVASAVGAGSLLVGRSVRSSLVKLVGRALGDIDHVVTSPHLFTEGLGARLAGDPVFARRFSGPYCILSTRGSLKLAEGGASAPGVYVFGRPDQPRGSCCISVSVAEALGVKPGAAIILRAGRLLGGAAALPVGVERTELAILRLRVESIASPGGFEDAFSLHPSQRSPSNVWVNLHELQEAIGEPGRANLLLVSSRWRSSPTEELAALRDVFRGVAESEDYGLVLKDRTSSISIESHQIVFPRGLEEVLSTVFPDAVRISAYLADTIRDDDSARELPYSTVVGVSALPLGGLKEGKIFLNRWAAEELAAGPGHRIVLAVSVRSEAGVLEERSGEFLLDGVLEDSPSREDRYLVPEFKGITDVASIAEWRPPRDFDFRLERIRPSDEDYWRRFGPAPKVFMSLADAKKLWGGAITSFRVCGLGMEDIRRRLISRLSPEAAGFSFRALRAEAVEAASSGAEFGELFAGMSSFIFGSAVLLVALIVQLHVEQRKKQIGILGALGFTARQVRRLFVAESMLVIAFGALAGGGLSLGFSSLILGGLRTIWLPAVGTKALVLEPAAGPVLVGVATALGAGMLSSFLASRRVLHLEPIEALAGRSAEVVRARRSHVITFTASIATFVLGLFWIVLGVLRPGIAPGAFFAAGAFLLGAFLGFTRSVMIRVGVPGASMPKTFSLTGLAARSFVRSGRRNILAAGLLAVGTFVVIGVGAMSPVEQDPGYILVAEFQVPLPYDLGDRKARELLGLSAHEELLDGMRFVCMRTSSGEDASCLNLLRPRRPRIVAVGERLGEVWHLDASVWGLLERALPDGAVPALADYESATWTLKRSLGQEIAITDERGMQRNLVLAGLIRKSLFQGDILVGQRAFAEMFPSAVGYGVVLIAPKDSGRAEELPRVGEVLRRGLADFGVSVQTARERLASFAQVAGTYISAFQALGSLGVFLGTAGLLAVFARNLAERRTELALLGALGFTSWRTGAAISLEFVFVAAMGVGSGCLCALLAVAPEFLRAGAGVGPTLRILGTFVAMAGVVCAALAVAGAMVASSSGPQALRRE